MGIREPVLTVETEEATYALHVDLRPPACTYVLVSLAKRPGQFRFRILNAEDLDSAEVFRGLPEAIQDKILALRQYGYDVLTNDVAGGAA